MFPAGQVITEKGYMSTSADAAVASGFADRASRRVRKPAPVMVAIDTADGVDVSGVSECDEAEVILPRGMQLRVCSLRYDDVPAANDHPGETARMLVAYLQDTGARDTELHWDEFAADYGFSPVRQPNGTYKVVVATWPMDEEECPPLARTINGLGLGVRARTNPKFDGPGRWSTPRCGAAGPA